MVESMLIESSLNSYQLVFVDDFVAQVRTENALGSFFIVDATIFNLYRERLVEILPEGKTLLVEASETNKTYEKCGSYIEQLVGKGIRRDNRVVAIGGGVTQDITSFIASILYRGIKWVFFPTTLLSQADSCIGSKTSINLGVKKNLVGSFYPPTCIYLDLAFLSTLTKGEIKSGIGEMLHFFIYAGSPMIDRVSKEYGLLLQDHFRLVDFVRESLAIKKNIVEIDEFDLGERNKFNYGHTFGHALETLTNYEINHGQAVTLGMDMANYISRSLGFMKPEVYDYLHDVLHKNFPVCLFENYSIDFFMAALERDKKNVDDFLVCILAKDKGQLFKEKLLFNEGLKKIILSYFKEIHCCPQKA